MKARLSKLICILGLLPAPGVWAQNLVVNGGFETGNFSSWTQFGSTGFSGVINSAGDPAAPSPEGVFHAYFGPLNLGGIFQNFATTVGQVYQVSYLLNAGQSSASTRRFRAQVGSPSAPVTLETLTNPSLFGYTLRSFTFTATTSVSQIRFAFENDPNYWRLDGVSVRNAAPELDSSTSLPGLVFLCGLVLSLERRKRKTLGPLGP